LTFIGAVEARQGCQVFSTAGRDHLVFVPSGRGEASFCLTLVSNGRVETVEQALTKSGVTSGSLLNDEKVAAALGSEESLGLRFDLFV
jgi:hypothetical protein